MHENVFTGVHVYTMTSDNHTHPVGGDDITGFIQPEKNDNDSPPSSGGNVSTTSRQEQEKRRATEESRVIHVKDLDDGSYRLLYCPRFIGHALVHIFVNGEPIRGSPFRVFVASAAFAPLAFAAHAQPGVQVSLDRKQCSISSPAVVLAQHRLPPRHVSWVAVKVLQVGGGLALGVADVEEGGWSQGSSDCVRRPVCADHAGFAGVSALSDDPENRDAWLGLDDGDTIVLKVDLQSHLVTFTNVRMAHRPRTVELRCSAAGAESLSPTRGVSV
jgi:hypothetical protein